MSTQAQIIANRRNAQKSTGPRTPEGKAVASQNSVRHGLSAAKDVISSESQADFDLHRDRIIDELEPDGPMESILVDRIVTLSWRLKRVGRFQNQTIDTLNTDNTDPSPFKKLTRSLLLKYQSQPPSFSSASHDNLPLGRLAVKDFGNARVLERLLMHERRIENSLYKTLLELQRLQLVKKMNPKREMPF
jgi:hypothetical protein